MSLRRQTGYAQPTSDDAIVSELAKQDEVPWYSKPNLRFLYLLMLPACIGVEMATGFDVTMVNGLQAIPSWLEYFHHPRSALLGFMVAVYSLGSVAAVPFAPFVIDKFGRRCSILAGSIIVMIGGIMQGFALNTTMFIVARFIMGFVDVFCVVAASSLVGELSHPNERAVMGCLFCGVYDLGATAAAGVVLATFSMTSNWGWRIPSLLQAFLSTIPICFIWFLPESPRWLISKGRRNEAYAILVKYHAEGDETSKFVRAEYAQIEQTLEAEQEAAGASWKMAFSTAAMRRRLMVTIFLGLSSQWCGYGLTAYFLSPILDTIGVHDNRTKNIINLARISWSFVNNMVWSFTLPRYPRRSVYLVCTISLFVVFTSWTTASAVHSFTQSQISAQVVLVLVFLIIPAYNPGFMTLIYTYLVELFPFHARARGITIFQLWLRIGGFTSQIANPIGIEAVGWKWYIAYCVWNAFEVVFVYLAFPETSGRTLEELSFLYESDQVLGHHSEVEALCSHRNPEIYYDTMEDQTGHLSH